MNSDSGPSNPAGTWMGRLDEILEQHNFVTDGLQKIEEKTNIKKRYIALVIIVIIAIYLIVGYGASLLCNVIGFVYPAYISVKAIESADKDDDTEWLMYWVVFAAFSVCEFFSDIFLSWFPFYFLAKCIFLLWCMAPITNNGSRVIYLKLIRPFILKNENKIDDVLDVVNLKGRQFAESAAREVQGAAAAVAADVVTEGFKKNE